MFVGCGRSMYNRLGEGGTVTNCKEIQQFNIGALQISELVQPITFLHTSTVLQVILFIHVVLKDYYNWITLITTYLIIYTNNIAIIRQHFYMKLL